jgi:hypothetical protein
MVRAAPTAAATAARDRKVRDAGVGEDRVEQCRVLPIPIPDHVLHPAAGIVEVHDEVPGRLGNPRRGRVGGGAENAYPAGRVFDDRQDVQPGAGQRRRLEEVGGEDGLGLGALERRPGVAGALGCRVDTGVLEHLPHGRGGDLDTEDE